MTDPEHVAALLDELEEEYEVSGQLGLYHFMWWLRSVAPGMTGQAARDTCQAVYDQFRQRHPTRLVTLVWPAADNSEAVPVDEATTELDFDLDPDGPVGRPFLALVPA